MVGVVDVLFQRPTASSSAELWVYDNLQACLAPESCSVEVPRRHGTKVASWSQTDGPRRRTAPPMHCLAVPASASISKTLDMRPWGSPQCRAVQRRCSSTAPSSNIAVT